MVVVSNQSRRLKLLFGGAFVLLLFCVVCVFVSNLHIRRISSRASLLPSADDLRRDIVRCVALEVRAVVATLEVVRADSPAPSPSAPSFTPRFVSVEDFSTWETPRHEPRACVNGVECGVGDFVEWGVVLSIRRNRLICRSDDGLVLVASRRPSPTPALPPTGGMGGSVEGEGNVPSPSW